MSRGYDILSPCALELIESVANCKAYAQNQSFPAFSFGVSRTGGGYKDVLSCKMCRCSLLLLQDGRCGAHLDEPGGR